MSPEERARWTTLVNTTEVIVRVQAPAPAPPEAFEVTFEVIDVQSENVTQFRVSPDEWYEIRDLVEQIIHRRMA
jgi:hypothetical protein